MDKRRIRQIVLKLVRAMANQNIRTKKVILFGSYARSGARQHKDSDLDLLFVSSDFQGLGLWERSRLLANAHWEVPDYPIDLVSATPEEWENDDSLIINYARQGRPVRY
ncbi:MAG: nucleotidyltransferase domain-containing protein [Planctomycetota bacterium]